MYFVGSTETARAIRDHANKFMSLHTEKNENYALRQVYKQFYVNVF